MEKWEIYGDSDLMKKYFKDKESLGNAPWGRGNLYKVNDDFVIHDPQFGSVSTSNERVAKDIVSEHIEEKKGIKLVFKV